VRLLKRSGSPRERGRTVGAAMTAEIGTLVHKNRASLHDIPAARTGSGWSEATFRQRVAGLSDGQTGGTEGLA